MMTFWRMCKFGLQNFTRNIWLSLITILIVALNLFLMSLVSGLNVVGRETLAAVRQKVNLSVYFTPTTSEQRVGEVRQELLRRPEVLTIRLISRAEHLEALEKVRGSIVKEAVDALGSNPLGAGLVITAKSLDGYGAIAQVLKQPQYKSIIEDTGNDFATNQTVISRLTLFVNRLQAASFWFSALFAIIAILMVFNTIRVTIYTQREEIGIMKLVGASDAFVRGPFIVASLLYGLIAGLVVTAVLLPILSIVNPKLEVFFAGYDINVLGYFRQYLWAILGLEVGAGCFLSGISSLFAISRYLRV